MDNRNYTAKEIDAYNKEREKYNKLQIQKETEYKLAINELDKAIEELNEVLKSEGIETVTKENFEARYEELNKFKNDEMAKGIKIMQELKKEMGV